MTNPSHPSHPSDPSAPPPPPADNPLLLEEDRPGDQVFLQPPGRPTVLTEARLTRILHYIGLGLNYRQACQAVGIADETFRRWRLLQPGLHELILRAKAQAIASHLDQIQTASQKNWRAAAWWLERKDRLSSGSAPCEYRQPDLDDPIDDLIHEFLVTSARVNLLRKLEREHGIDLEKLVSPYDPPKSAPPDPSHPSSPSNQDPGDSFKWPQKPQN